MINISIKFHLYEFNGNTFETMDQIESNIYSNIASLKRKIPNSFGITFSILQSSKDTFTTILRIKNTHKPISEDVTIGQIESNFNSLKKRGLLNTGLHNWELTTSFIQA